MLRPDTTPTFFENRVRPKHPDPEIGWGSGAYFVGIHENVLLDLKLFIYLRLLE